MTANDRQARLDARVKESLKGDPRDASQIAMDEIQQTCGYYKEPWEYPGQVVRDVRRLKAERDAAQAESRALGEQVLAANALIEDIFWYTGGESSPLDDCYIADRAKAFHESTSTAAARVRESIERGAIAKARQIVSDIEDDYPASVFGSPGPGASPDCYSAGGARLACARIASKLAAILGTGEAEG